jgi:tetratricopeptide (TPR) repeat protein
MKRYSYLVLLFVGTFAFSQSPSLMEAINRESDTPAFYRVIDLVYIPKLVDSTVVVKQNAIYLEKWAKEHNDEKVRIQAIYTKAFNRKTKGTNFVELITEGIRLSKKENSPIQEANGYVYIANHYRDLGSKIIAYENYIKGFELYEQIGYKNIPALKFRAYDYGYFLYGIQEYKSALQILTICKKYNALHPVDSFLQIHVPTAMALCYRKLNDFNLSVSYNKELLEVVKKDKNSIWEGITLGNLANDYISLKKYNEAIPYLQTSITLAQQNNIPENKAEGQARLAQCYLSLEKNELAFSVLKQADTSVNKYGDINTKINYYFQYSNYFKNLKNESQELFYLKKYQSLKDSLANATFGVQYLNDRVKLEAERNLEKIKRIESDKKIAVFTRNIIILGFLFFAVIGLGFFNYKRLKYKQRQTLLKLEKEKLEQEKLVKEKELQAAELKLQEFTQNIIEKNNLIEQIQTELSKKEQQGIETITHQKDLEKINQLSQLTILTESDWQAFKHLFESAFPNFLTTIHLNYPQITNSEIRFLCLSQLKLSVKDMANMLAISPESLRKIKYRLRDKLAESGKDISVLLA